MLLRNTCQIFSTSIAAAAAALIAPAAQAEVYEFGASGTFVEITRHQWQSERPAKASLALNERAISSENSSPATTLTPHQAKIEAAAADFGLAPELVKAVAWQESRFNARARSASGALGVMQLMPGTARQLGVTNPLDPEQNIRGGTAYLRRQLDRFDNDLTLALAAYNAGPGAVIRYRGVPPFRETRAYVRSILAHLAIDADAGGSAGTQPGELRQ